MLKNLLKEKQLRGETAFGVRASFPSPDLVEMCGYLGFDFVILDCEHGPTTIESAAHVLRAAQCSGITPIVSVPVNDAHLIMRYLDIGALGVQVPHIHSRREAEAAVRAVKYYPMGQRGIARPRSGHYGLVGTFQEYMEASNRETLIAALIENVDAMQHLPEILNVEGIDVFFAGPGDLSQSLGIPGQWGTPLMQSAIDTIIKQVRDAGRAVGISVSDAAAARSYIEKGVQCIVTGSVGLLARGAREFLTEARSVL